MKNVKHESRRLNAIRELASGKITDHRRLKDGVYVPHVYAEPYDALSYWDDFGFRLNRQWVSVAWVHPRMALMDHVEDVAHDMANAVSPYQHTNFLDEMTPNYVKVGRSRKKHLTSTWHGSPANDAYFEAYRNARLDILKGADGNGFSVPANKLSVEQMDYGKFVSMRTPVELVNETDIIAYAHQVKAHLKGETNILGSKDEVYTLNDYRRDMERVGQEIK